MELGGTWYCDALVPLAASGTRYLHNETSAFSHFPQRICPAFLFFRRVDEAESLTDCLRFFWHTRLCDQHHRRSECPELSLRFLKFPQRSLPMDTKRTPHVTIPFHGCFFAGLPQVNYSVPTCTSKRLTGKLRVPEVPLTNSDLDSHSLRTSPSFGLILRIPYCASFSRLSPSQSKIAVT
jgi:hypothetical protein